MGAQPKRKISTVQQKVRRAAKHMEVAKLGRCSHCGAPVRTHHMCTNCGYYKDRPVLAVKNG